MHIHCSQTTGKWILRIVIDRCAFNVHTINKRCCNADGYVARIKCMMTINEGTAYFVLLIILLCIHWYMYINIIHFTTGNERASRNDDTIEYDNSIRRGSVELWRSRRCWLKRMPTITATEWPILLKRSRQSISIISFAVHSWRHLKER